jgi:hypothetical protein
MKRSLKYIFVLSVVVLACTMAMQAQPITNGNFGNNNVGGPCYGCYAYVTGYTLSQSNVSAPPWYFSGSPYDGSGVQSNGSAWGFNNAPNGSQYSAFLQGSSYVSQTMGGLTPGENYAVSFYLSTRGYGQLNPVGVIFAGALNPVDNTVIGTPATTITLNPGQSWTSYTVEFQAAGTSELLTFEGMNGSLGQTRDTDTGLANVNVAFVPEPAMALLLPFGLLFVNGLRKRFPA